MHMYMLMYFKLQTMCLYIKFQAILNYLRTGELHLPSFICGPAAREELLVILLDVFYYYNQRSERTDESYFRFRK